MRVTIDMPDSLYNLFSEKCYEVNMSRAEVIRALIKDWVVPVVEEMNMTFEKVEDDRS